MIPRRSTPVSAGLRLALVSAPIIAINLVPDAELRAQEALRTAVEGDRNYQNRRRQAIESPMRMYAGPVGFSVGAGLGLTYDDNVLLQENDPQEDYIIAPSANVGLFWPITDRTRLNLGIGVSYEIYTEGTRDDRFALAPDSNIAFDFEIGRTLVTLYDTFSFSQDLLEQGEVSNTGDYGGFNNTAGVRAIWAPEPLFAEGGYSWNLFISSEDTFSELDRNSHQVFARFGQIIAEQTRWGAEATGSETLYDAPVRNDFTSISVGPFLEWQATQSLNLSLRGGWTWSMFDDNGTTTPPEDVSVPYVGLTVDHQLTAAFRHNLSAIREVRVGVNTEYVETFTVTYGFNWRLTELIGFGAGAFYEIGEEPGVLATEEYDRVGANFSLPFQFNEHLSAALGYQHTVRDSNTDGRGYTNNRATVTAGYTF
ncbi:MAG TPA: hypothetical protein DCY13_08165 [Verrucomicrobiales bacterium]|nr:hypothetical protein [Verrucomicrobiales bacterium]